MRSTVWNFAHLPESLVIPGIRIKSDAFMAMICDWPLAELHNGEMHFQRSHSMRHQSTLSPLLSALFNWVDTRDLGEVFHSTFDWVADDDNVVQPDLLWFPKGHPRLDSADNLERTPPALVVEILSPSTASIDRGHKFELYQRRGVAHYWIVDRDARRVEAYELVDGKYQECGSSDGETLSAPPFADLKIDLNRLFAD